MSEVGKIGGEIRLLGVPAPAFCARIPAVSGLVGDGFCEEPHPAATVPTHATASNKSRFGNRKSIIVYELAFSFCCRISLIRHECEE